MTVAGDNMENKVFLICPPTCSRIKLKNYKPLFLQMQNNFYMFEQMERTKILQNIW